MNKHIKENEKRSENKVQSDLEGYIKIEKESGYDELCEKYNEDTKILNFPGLGNSDGCFEVLNDPLYQPLVEKLKSHGVNIIRIEVKGGKGETKERYLGWINLNQLRLWKGEVVILECSHSPAYDVDYCVIPANFLIRTAFSGHAEYRVRPLHQHDVMACAGMKPNPRIISRDFGCSASELKEKVMEAHILYEEDIEVKKVVEKARDRHIRTVHENKELKKTLE